jgi:PAS domain-containing protein
MIGTCQDVTGRHEIELERERLLGLERQARQESDASRRLLTSILERVSDGFVALDKDWCYTHVNQKAGDLLGATAGSADREAHLVGVPRRSRAEVLSRLQPGHMREQVPISIEEYYPPWRKWFENRIHPSSRTGCRSSSRTSRSRHRAQDAFEGKQERFREIAEVVGEAFRVISPDLKTVQYVSRRFENIFGVRPIRSIRSSTAG